MAKRASYADAGWGALNLLTEPSEFDFSVALGAMPVGVRESESSTIRVFGPRETGVCRVHLTRERSERVPDSGGAPLCRVEVLSPLADESREFDLAEECIRQLELALRLFKPASFRLIPWKQRGELRALRTGPCYSLDQAELRRFREFSERLMALHVELKHYQWAQAIPEDTSDDVYELFGTSRSAIQETLGGAYLMIATTLFERGHRDWRQSTDLRLVLLMMASEALVGCDRAELAYRLSLRLSVLNGGTNVERRNIFQQVRSLYDLRSRLLHGALYSDKKGFARVTEADVLNLSKLVRGSLLYFLALRSDGKAGILRALDRAIFDDSELGELRKRANRFWGLGERSDECLYSPGRGA